MKRIYLLVMVFVMYSAMKANAQIQAPVKWSYALKKINGASYEVHLLATIDQGWHIYAQKQNEASIAIPTKISFKKALGLALVGTPVENGIKDAHVIKELGITNMQYAGKVDFVQKITLKGTTAKAITGSIVYQACNEQMCLPPETVNFSVPVN